MDPTQEQATPFSSILGTSAPAPASPPVGMAQVVQPTPQGDISQEMTKPASSPEDLTMRKEGWRQVLADPNFRRALGFAGAYLAQPIPAGQTRMGHMGMAFNVGQTAMQAGEYSQFNQDQAATEAARKEKETAAKVKFEEAETANRQAQKPSISAKAQVDAATVDARVQQEKDAAAATALKLKAAQRADDLAPLEDEIKKRRLQVEKDIPDEKIRAAALAEVDASVAKLDEARARIAASQAATKASGVRTAHDQITVDVLKSMPEAEQKEFLTKTGRYSTHVNSATVARDMYGNIYDGLQKSAPNDPRIKGKTREQFVLDGITSQKSLDASTGLKNYAAAMSAMNQDPDPEILQAYADLIKQGAAGRAGKAGSSANAGGPSTSGVIEFTRDKDGKLVRKAPAQ